MPEIKNVFQQGKMNKDLDERLVPNGQYRDAMNIQVSTSEGGEVGTAQNILGNIRVEDIVGDNFKCVGAIADEKNNVLYWFITSLNVDAIIEYRDDPTNQTSNTCTPILVDTNKNVLKFDYNKIITGINIIDDLLFWTDDVNEPRKINIKRCKDGSQNDLYTHTKLIVSDEVVTKEIVETFDASSTGINFGGTDTIELSDVSKLKEGDKLIKIRNWVLTTLVTITNIDLAINTVTLSSSILSGASGYINTGDEFTFSTEVEVDEDHITIIKKKPNSAPVIEYVETLIEPVYTTIIDQTPNDDVEVAFIDASGSLLNPGDEVDIDISMDSTATPNFPELFSQDSYDNWGIDDILLLSPEALPGNLPQNYQVKGRIINKYQPASVTGYAGGVARFRIEIEEISNYITVIPGVFKVTKQLEKDPIFEKEFIRFGTRYKYIDGEYSAFSPFTQPVFMAGSFGFHPTKNPYNAGMSNKIINIKLKNLVTPVIPEDVIQIDILFKKERSTTIYSVDSIKPTDPTPSGSKNAWYSDTSGDYWGFDITLPPTTWASQSSSTGVGLTTENYSYYHGEYIISTENIYAALPENQILRPWDNVPRQALAQEITANRIVYGNYIQNYNLQDFLGNPIYVTPSLSYETRNYANQNTEFPTGKRSIKSERTYYLGVIYGDKYGRETPILTGVNSSVKIPFDLEDAGGIVNFDGAASNSLRLTANLQGEVPYWADYYKYFIKQTTGEYYNLTMDRVYKADGDDSLWLSFPSSDRNKVQEGDYLTIKKQSDVDSQIPVENKIKVVDIKNEAPESIKWKYSSMGSGGGTSSDLNNLFPDVNARPASDVKRISVDRQSWIETEFGMDLDPLTPSDKLAIQFTTKVGSNIVLSRKYHVTTWFKEDAGDDGRWNFLLEDTIDDNDDWVESSTGVLNADDQLQMYIYKMDDAPAREFDGRFFIKITADTITQTYLIPSTANISSQNFQIVARCYAFWLADSNTPDNPTTPSTPLYSQVFNAPIPWSANTYTNTSGNGIGGSYYVSSGQDAWRQTLRFNTSSDSSRGWFIDNTYFASAQEPGGPHAHNSINSFWDANKSGGMHKGAITDNNGNNPNQLVMGMPGIINITGNPKFSFDTNGDPMGSMHWSKKHFEFMADHHNSNSQISTTSFSNNYYREAYSGNEVGSEKWTRTYDVAPNDPGIFMHLSFSSVGIDLHDGDFEDLDDNWADFDAEMFKDNLQWICSSGIYFAHDAGNFGDASGSVNSNYTGWSGEPVVYNHEYGHNITEFNANVSSAGVEAHDNQFNPSWNNASAQGVVNKLTTGSKFQFEGDPSTTYTILGVDVKYLYNHTTWNPRIGFPNETGTETIHRTGYGYPANSSARMSVSEALYEWSVNTQNYNAYDTLRNAIVNFGKANNRRVVYIIQLDKDPLNAVSGYNPNSTWTYEDFQNIRFIEDHVSPGENTLPASPAIFETEAEEDIDLNIYYEISDALPVRLTEDNGHVLAPIGSKVHCSKSGSMIPYDSINDIWSDQIGLVNSNNNQPPLDFFLRVSDWDGDILTLDRPGLIPDSWTGSQSPVSAQNGFIGETLTFYRPDLSYTKAKIAEVISVAEPPQTAVGGYYITKVKIASGSHKEKVGLQYYNCFSFGNGVESNRIRDDYNESFILNGVKASAVLEEPYEEERRKYGLIYSGIYNSISGVNNLNQFIQAEKITKDIMPSYGSIQKLYARDKDLITLCEDKILQIFVDKDVLYNADGNQNLLATNRVLGQANPFRGEYGISKNPESFASESFRAYFTDKQKGAVLRLSMDGLTPISDAGMHDWFRDHLRDGGKLYGSFDLHKKDYNLTIFYPDGKNLLLNPGFEIGGEYLTTTTNELLPNETFNDTTLGWGIDSIEDGIFDDNTLADWTVDAGQGGIYHASSNGNENSGDGSGAVLFLSDGPNLDASGGTIIQDITNLNLVNGDFVKFGFELFTDLAGMLSGFPGLVWENATYPTDRVKIIVYNGNGDGFHITHGDIQAATGGNFFDYGDKIYFTRTVGTITTTNPQFFNTMRVICLTVDPLHHFFVDNISLQIQDAVTNNWTIAGFNNQSGTLVPNPLSTYYPLTLAFQSGLNIPPENYQVKIDIANVIVPGLLFFNTNLQSHQILDAGGNNTITTPGIYTLDVNFSQTVTKVTIINMYGSQFEIASVSLKELVPYGGNIIPWNLIGDPGQIYYDEQMPPLGVQTLQKYVTFNDAIPGTSLSQIIPLEHLPLTVGDRYRITFTISNHGKYNLGSLGFRLYDNYGEGFLVQGQNIKSNGQYEFFRTIGDHSIDSNAVIAAHKSKFSFFVEEWDSVNDTYSSAGNATIYSGSIDDITLEKVGGGETISFSEDVKGWVSFKSFVPEFGLSVVNQYYTMYSGRLFKHHINEIRNTFYTGEPEGGFTESSITPILNLQPGVVKNFNTLNYEGSQSKIDVNLDDRDYYNLHDKKGWYVYDIHTDKQEGTVNEFIEKEGKWFNYIKGRSGQKSGTTLEMDLAALNFQGIGIVNEIIGPPILGCTNPNATNFDPLADTDDGSCTGFSFEMQIRDTIDPAASDGTARVVYTGTNIEATGFTYAWSTGATTSEVTGLSMGYVALTLTDGQGVDYNMSGFVMATLTNGCTNPAATNFNYSANTDDATCII